MIQSKAQPLTKTPRRGATTQPVTTQTTETVASPANATTSSINSGFTRFLIGSVLWGISVGVAIGSAWAAYQSGDVVGAATTFTLVLALSRGTSWLAVRI